MTRALLTTLSTALLLTLAACDAPAGEDGTDGVDGQDGANGADGASGQDGANGQDGEDGADGQDGAPGADGEDGFLDADAVYWEETTQTISAWTGSGTSAWCDYGDIVIGGGWDSDNSYPFTTIYPYDNGPVASSGYEGWSASIANYSEDDFDVTVTAICVAVD